MPRIDFTKAQDAGDLARAALAAACAAADLRLAACAEDAMARLTGAVPLTEKLSWAAKEAAARACLGGLATDLETAIMADEAEERDETPRDLAARIVARAERWHRASARITGIRHRLSARLALAEDAGAIAQVLEEAESLMARPEFKP